MYRAVCKGSILTPRTTVLLVISMLPILELTVSVAVPGQLTFRTFAGGIRFVTRKTSYVGLQPSNQSLAKRSVEILVEYIHRNYEVQSNLYAFQLALLHRRGAVEAPCVDKLPWTHSLDRRCAR
jgi:hypothetical protein